MDFVTYRVKTVKNCTEIRPRFLMTNRSKDLMIRGGDFYAIWLEDSGMWSTDEQDAIDLIDKGLDEFAKGYQETHPDEKLELFHLKYSDTGMIDKWHKYCQNQMRDRFKPLDEKIIFANSPTDKNDYASKRLSYSLSDGPIESYDKLISTLYNPEERHKIEWAIGAVVNGASKDIQKFLVFYGDPGTGKSTILHIIEKLFEGYWSAFVSKDLGSANAQFALEPFKSNPLVAIEHDGDLSKIKNNTRLNSLASHETMVMNVKFMATYPVRINTFMFMGTNKPVEITDSKSGLRRRLIDVHPSGKTVPKKEYDILFRNVDFELGHIAYHCLKIYEENPSFYDDYIPTKMISATNVFYNFILDSLPTFIADDEITLSRAWKLYKLYCEDSKIERTIPRNEFREELKNYFWEFNEELEEDYILKDVYSRFRKDRIDQKILKKIIKDEEDIRPNISEEYRIDFKEQHSILDDIFKDCKAQYGNFKETPATFWDNVTTTLKELDTTKLHYLLLPWNHIVIDFDLKDSSGKKSFELNLKEASKWPKTYAELSKSGEGIHLHYIYTGDVTKLSCVFSPGIEVKVFTGKSSLRRRLSKCNNLPIALISSGLPLKEDSKVVNYVTIANEKDLVNRIKKCIKKEYSNIPSTTQNINFIKKILDDAYDSVIVYDVSSLRGAIIKFAENGTNKQKIPMNLSTISKMKFTSEPIYASGELELNIVHEDRRIVLFDIEVFPNFFGLCWKFRGEEFPVVKWKNPTPQQIEELSQYNLIGFNCRKYDNHLCVSRMEGKSVKALYDQSQDIITNKRGYIGYAYNFSYTDILDFASAGNKKSLKQWEIELGIHHDELGLPWDQPVPEELWDRVMEYCGYDVLATEKVFDHLSGDFKARLILADISGLTPNDTTNTHTTKIIFGDNKHPQKDFNWYDMGDTNKPLNKVEGFDEYTCFDDKGRAVFPGYKMERGVSTYRGYNVGEGGLAWSNPGAYSNVALLDIASMHPSSIIALNLFGDEYTKRFKEIKDGRVAVKHLDFEAAKNILGGVLMKYLNEQDAPDLAAALKTAINSVYGLTAAGFENPFRDPRNVDNIVAKRGALFMVNLKEEVEKRGYTVVHIKTDSIKIADATPEIIQFVMDYGKLYGYDFEHEATYSRMCIVNKSVYIAQYADGKHAGEWTATGDQFKVPYVFKTLFSHEPIDISDMTETNSVQTAIYLDFNENLPEGEHDYHFVGKVGAFCPMIPGAGGGELLRQGIKADSGEVKYDSVSGSKGYRWMESEMVKVLGKENQIDITYYNKLVDAAKEALEQYCDFEWLINGIERPEDDITRPPWFSAEEPYNEETTLFDLR